MGQKLIVEAQVETVYDDADGLRIKVRLAKDGTKSVDELPYAFPLLPKTIQSVPKVGECVLVIFSELSNEDSNRWYIGPIISQPQRHEYDSYSYGRGTALALLHGGATQPLEKISNYAETDGSFPNVNDIALVGRKSEDIILKDGEIDLRCGIRGEAIGDDKLVGNVVFNKQSPSYIQMKYKKGLMLQDEETQGDSVVNVVADKINLISHQDKNQFDLTDNKELIKETDLENIMRDLHQLPYGDILVDVLKKIVLALTTHVHPYPGMPPCKDSSIKDIEFTNLNTILSDNVRIS